MGNGTAPLSEDDRAAMTRAAAAAVDFRAALARAAVKPELRPAAFAAAFDTALPEEGTAAATVIDELIGIAGRGIHGHASPRFFGYVCGGSMPVGAAADFLVTAWGQNAASSWESPAVAVIEETLCR